MDRWIAGPCVVGGSLREYTPVWRSTRYDK